MRVNDESVPNSESMNQYSINYKCMTHFSNDLLFLHTMLLFYKCTKYTKYQLVVYPRSTVWLFNLYYI